MKKIHGLSYEITIFLTAITILSALIPACTSAPTVQETGKLLTRHYTSQEYSLEIDYHEGWHVDFTADGIIFATVPSLNVSRDGGAGFGILMLSSDEVEDNFRAGEEAGLDQVFRAFGKASDTRIEDIVDRPIGGITGKSARIVIEADTQMAGEMSIVKRGDNYLFFVTVVKPPADRDQYEPVFDAMYESVVFN